MLGVWLELVGDRWISEALRADASVLGIAVGTRCRP